MTLNHCKVDLKAPASGNVNYEHHWGIIVFQHLNKLSQLRKFKESENAAQKASPTAAKKHWIWKITIAVTSFKIWIAGLLRCALQDYLYQ